MERRIVCFGDSNTYGFNPITEQRYDAKHRWPEVLRQKLENTFDVVSEGLNGRTTMFGEGGTKYLSGLDYMVPCLLSHAPIDLLIIMLGTNDCGIRGITAEKIAEGAERLVHTALYLPVWQGVDSYRNCLPVFKSRILLIVPAEIQFVEDTSGYNIDMIYASEAARHSRELVSCYKKVSDRLGIEFMDANEYAAVGSDHVHLTENAHIALGEGVADKVRGMMEKCG